LSLKAKHFFELTQKLEQTTQPLLCLLADQKRFAFIVLLSLDYTSKSHQKCDKNACKKDDKEERKNM
jgi:hypothetical protein